MKFTELGLGLVVAVQVTTTLVLAYWAVRVLIALTIYLEKLA